jgi:phosphate starvation-inducible PhoH-like protein
MARKKPGPDRSFNLKEVEAKTKNQQETLDAFNEGDHLVLHGQAGTGKTFLALYLGIREILNRNYSKVIIIRSVVPSREIGFLPGTAGEKMAVYEMPYQSICSELLGRGDAYELLCQKGFMEFLTTSYLRGTTLNNAVIIVDEIQNMNFQEINTVITRVGNNCKLIFCGDEEQNDLYRSRFDKSGISDFLDIIETCSSFAFIEFTEEDIVRSGIVKEWLKAKITYFENPLD